MAGERRQCTVSANVDKQGDACFDMRLVQPGIFNRGRGVASLGTSATSTEFSLRLDSERAWRGLFGSLEFGRQSKDLQKTCGYIDLSTQALCHVNGQFWEHGQWRVIGEWSLRDLDPRQPHPSIPLQQERLRSLKTSLKASLSWQPADDRLPSTRLTAEIAGPPGDVCFLRTQAIAESMGLVPRFTEWQLHFSGVLGLLLPLGKSCAQDRFHLGGASGPWALKGFADHGAEPRARRMLESAASAKDQDYNALGGEALASISVRACRPLEVASLEGLRFMTFGCIGVLQPSLWRRDEMLRASLGCGLALPLGPGAVEITFGQPVRLGTHDIRQRWQFGLRLQLGPD